MNRRFGVALAMAATQGVSAAAGNAQLLRHDPFAWPAAARAPAPPPAGASASAAQTPPPPWRPRLRAVVVAAGRSMALVDGSVVTIGEQLDGYRLIRVEERGATFVKNGLRVELRMDGGDAATR